jgi:hypothetical protein
MKFQTSHSKEVNLINANGDIKLRVLIVIFHKSCANTTKNKQKFQEWISVSLE